MSTIENIKERFHQAQSKNGSSPLTAIEQNAFNTFTSLGIPTIKHEEWKYTRISSLFNKKYEFTPHRLITSLQSKDIDAVRLPGYQQANELVFVNGLYSAPLSAIRSEELVILSLEEAAENGYGNIISKHLGHSSKYSKDGIHALNTAFINGGTFIHIKDGLLTCYPLYIYNITDSGSANTLSQPRTLLHVGAHAQMQVVETYITLGKYESFTNHVVEIIVEKEAVVEYYKIENDAAHTNLVSTTHFMQVARSLVHAVTITLNGNLVRNNLNIALEAEGAEANLFGLYFLKGHSHVDNHTVVDNVKPNCQSNELYKGIIDDNATAVFNGKILVQPQAQKTNAYQSNKNVLLSNAASVNTKPQLEIFADDVKCSHGCTIGRLDEEGLFYLRSRGISEKIARSLLVHAFAIDILEHIKPAPIRDFINRLISERLDFDIA